MNYMNTVEAAEAFGITKASLYLWIKHKKIPFEKVSRKEIRFLTTDVERICQERSQKKIKRIKKRRKWTILPKDTYSADDVRKMLGVTRTRVWQLYVLGELKFDKNFYPAIITKEDFENYLHKRKNNNNGYIGVCEAMIRFKMPHNKIHKLIKSGELESVPYRVGSKRILIKEDSFDKITEASKYARDSYTYKDIPDGYITSVDAAEKLKTNVHTIWRLAKSGRLESIIKDTKYNSILIKESCVLQDLVTVDQASYLLKKPEKAILRLIQSKKLESVVNEFNEILIPAKALETRNNRRFQARA
jgi:excisionase family DNA binding protein